MCAILDLNINSDSAKCIYLLLKKMLQETLKLKNLMESTEYLHIQSELKIENLTDWFDYK